MVTENGSLLPGCSLSSHSLPPSLTVLCKEIGAYLDTILKALIAESSLAIFSLKSFQAFGGNTTDDTLEGWINEIDSDGDAKVNLHEFIKFNAMSLKKKKDKEAIFFDQM